MDSPKLHPDRVAVLFNGDYALSSPKNGEVRTLQVRTQHQRSGFCPGRRVVKLLLVEDAPEDFYSWEGFAFCEDVGIHVWRSKQGEETRSLHDKLAAILWGIEVRGEASKWFELGYRVEARYRCIACNRPLANEESMKTGIGSICAGRRKPNKKTEKKNDDESPV